MDHLALPKSIRFVKNGQGGQWWPVAKAHSQIHLGWPNIPRALLVKPDLKGLAKYTSKAFGTKPGATQDLNQLKDLLYNPSSHIWVTFEDGFLWWCTVNNGAVPNPEGQSRDKGNFWLACNRPWANTSLDGKLLAIANLPGSVTKTKGFRGTICLPQCWEAYLRIIKGERDECVQRVLDARNEYRTAICEMIKRLNPYDFEELIDLVLFRSGWMRISKLGGTTEGIDIEAENLAASEIAFIQIKSSARQSTLEDYISRFNARKDRYARMMFVVHSPIGRLITSNPSVQIWEGERVADLVIRLGLGEWLQGKLA